MCEWNDTIPILINGRLCDIDRCISKIVTVLNSGGLPTVASCCGHGKSHGNIALLDGRFINIHSILSL